MINALICIPSPRDLWESKFCTDRIRGYDKFWVMYHYEPHAYTAMRDFFVSHQEYTHMVLVPDDLIYGQADIDQLARDIEQYDYPITGGICNQHYLQRELYSPCLDLPGEAIDTYHFVNKAQIDEWRAREQYLQSVKFDGFALTFIRRDVIEKIRFRGEWATDGHFARDLDAAGIPIFIDVRVELFHLKYRIGYGKYESMQIGIKSPSVRFVPK